MLKWGCFLFGGEQKWCSLMAMCFLDSRVGTTPRPVMLQGQYDGKLIQNNNHKYNYCMGQSKILWVF